MYTKKECEIRLQVEKDDEGDKCIHEGNEDEEEMKE